MMRLELTDFRCYKGTHAVDLAPGRVTLIQGVSGAGKTTLFHAIEWALFGRTSLLGSSSSGTTAAGKKTTVSLTWAGSERTDGLDLFIRRVRGNNKLVLKHGMNAQLEGEVAQGRIVTLFGTETLWKACSYLRQNELCSLLEMTRKADILAELGHLAYGFQTGHCSDLACLTPDAAKARIDLFISRERKRAEALGIDIAKQESVLSQFNAQHNLDVAAPPVLEPAPGPIELEESERAVEKAQTALMHAQKLVPWFDALEKQEAACTSERVGLPCPLPTPEDLQRARRVGELIGEWERVIATDIVLPLEPVFVAPTEPRPARTWTDSEVTSAEQYERDRERWTRLFPGTPLTRSNLADALRRAQAAQQRATRRIELKKTAESDRALLSKPRRGVEWIEKKRQFGDGWVKRATQPLDVDVWAGLTVEVARIVLDGSGGKPGTPSAPTPGLAKKRIAWKAQLDGIRSFNVLPADVASRVSELGSFLDLATRLRHNKAVDRALAPYHHASVFSINEMTEQLGELTTRLAQLDREASFKRVMCPCCQHELRWTGSTLACYDDNTDPTQPGQSMIERTAARRAEIVEQKNGLETALHEMKKLIKEKERLELQRVPVGAIPDEWTEELATLDDAGFDEFKRERDTLAKLTDWPARLRALTDLTRADEALELALAEERTRFELTWFVERAQLADLAVQGLSVEREEAERANAEARERERVTLEDAIEPETEVLAELEAWPLPPLVPPTCSSDQMRRDRAALDAWTRYDQTTRYVDAQKQRDAIQKELEKEGETAPFPSLAKWNAFTGTLEQTHARAVALEEREQRLASERASRTLEWNNLTGTVWPTPLVSLTGTLKAARSEWDRLVQRRDRHRVVSSFLMLTTRLAETRKELATVEVQIEEARNLKKLAEVIETRLLNQIVVDLNASLETLCENMFMEPVSVYITLAKQNATNEGTRVSFDVHLIKEDRDVIVTEASGGEKGRISLALALALSDLPMLRGNSIMLLDEVMSGLDPESFDMSLETLKTFSQQRPWKAFVTVEQKVVHGMFDATLCVDHATVTPL